MRPVLPLGRHVHVHVLSALLLSSAAAHEPANDVDCAFRELAVRVASRNLHGDAGKLALVAAGLNATACPGGRSWAGEHARDSSERWATQLQPAGRSVFVSPTGSDTNAGTLAAPLKTLAAAKLHVRSLLHAEPGAVTVNLRAGTYYEMLLLSPADSGRPGEPVVWQSYGSEKAVISGGKKLTCETWTKSPAIANAYTCQLPETQVPFTALFLNGTRLQRARWPNGNPNVPCNGPIGCAAAGYTAAGSSARGYAGECTPVATPVSGQEVRLLSPDGLLLSSGIVDADPSAANQPAINLSVPDNPFVHDAGAFTNYRAYTGGTVACYNSSYNSPFWPAGTCGCRAFAVLSDAAERMATWKKPSTGVVHMFHSVRWGGWVFNITGFNATGIPAPPAPAPPPPLPPGTTWGTPKMCTSCEPHDMPLVPMTLHSTLAECQGMCENNSQCHYINYALEGNNACALFSSCSKPWHVTPPADQCPTAGAWWTLYQYNRNTGAGSTDDGSTVPFGGYGGLGLGGGVAPPTASARATLGISGGQQTGQQGSESISGNDYFVENILEELDAPGEFFLDGRKLHVIPPVGTRLSASSILESAVEPRVIQLRGASDTEFAHDIVIRNLSVERSAPTFMADYEMPSGGDWSIHRGGAVFLDGTENVTIENVEVDQAGGNGIFLSNHCWHTNIVGNTVAYAGDSAILLVGSTHFMNGTSNSFPAFTNISNNLCFEMGYYGKQTAAYFKSIAFKTQLVNNVFFNSPRSLVNYNDAFRGGDLMEGNVMWGAVKETADHASFNSWDRQSWFWEDEHGVTHSKPELQLIRRNLILNKDFQYGSANSDWAIDHDDASSWFEDSENVLVYGSHKWRDGVHKWYSSNLYVMPVDSVPAQTWGIGWYTLNTNSSRFTNNTMVSWSPAAQFHFCWSLPLPYADFTVAHNRYFTPGNSTLPFRVGGGGGMNPPGSPIPPMKVSAVDSLEKWQQLTGNDLGSTISADIDLQRVLAQAELYLQL